LKCGRNAPSPFPQQHDEDDANTKSEALIDEQKLGRLEWKIVDGKKDVEWEEERSLCSLQGLS
jgi:hypothetical protein